MVDLSRRAALLNSAAILALAGCSSNRLPGGSDEPASSQTSRAPRLWYRQPAVEWVEALPIGNGRLGAMVFGGVSHERLQLNEDTFYSGGPYDPDNRTAHEALPEVRQLSFASASASA